MKSSTIKKQSAIHKINNKKILNFNTPFAITEAYNTLRTNLMFTIKGERCPVFIVTSPLPNEGKTLNTVNLAVSFAHMDKKTLVIDMDMRNPTIHRMFDLPLFHGVSEFLAGMDKEIEYGQTTVENLKVVSAGQIPPNPADLLSGEGVAALLEHVRREFDYVFIDMPPLEVVADAAILAKQVTGYLLVVKKESSDLTLLKHTVGILEQVEANIVGFILNYVNPKEHKNRRLHQYGNRKYGQRNNP